MKYLPVLLFSFVCLGLYAQEKPGDAPRVFVTDSQSWETHAAAGGSGGNWGASSHGGARPQTAEIIKTFGERCPTVTVNNLESRADYIVELDHEGGKGYLQHRNKVAVFEHHSGDVVVSKSTLSLGGSVPGGLFCHPKALDDKRSDKFAPLWLHLPTLAPRPHQLRASSAPPELSKTSTLKLSVFSTPGWCRHRT